MNQPASNHSTTAGHDSYPHLAALIASWRRWQHLLGNETSPSMMDVYRDRMHMAAHRIVAAVAAELEVINHD